MSKHHQATGHIQSLNNYNSFNNTINLITKTDPEGHDILEWLSPLEPQLRHESVGAERLGAVGNWVLVRKVVAFSQSVVLLWEPRRGESLS